MNEETTQMHWVLLAIGVWLEGVRIKCTVSCWEPIAGFVNRFDFTGSGAAKAERPRSDLP